MQRTGGFVLGARIAAFFRRRSLDRDFNDELQSHLSLLEEDGARRGLSPEEARRTARVILGETGHLREAHREARSLGWLDSFLQDTRYALRGLRKAPAFTAAAVLTLALGIGANTAIFSTIDEALYRPLNFPQPDQLADVFTFDKSSQTFLSSSYPDYEDLRARTRSFQHLSALVRMPLNVSWGERNERVPVEAVTGNFFSMLQLAPVAGRVFRDSDDSIAAGRVAMISEELAGANSVGQRMVIEDEPFTIIGLVAKRYRGTNLNWGDTPRVWIPLQATAIIRPRLRALNLFHERAMQWLLVTGRLKAGVSDAQAQAEMQTIAAGIARSAPTTNRHISQMVFAASQAKFWPAYRSSITRSLTVFAVAAGLVLLLACANISNLLLSRAVARRREFAIRLALGAGRGRLLRQLVTESFLLAIPGCAAALAIAGGLSKLLAHFPNALGLPLALDGALELRVTAFCVALTVASTLFFGLAPAWRTTRNAVLPALKESGNTVSGGAHDWLRNFLVGLEVAFTIVLLVGGGLFGRSVMSAWALDPGFKTEGMLTAGFSAPPPGAASAARLQRGQSELLNRLRLMPDVQSVTLASNPPLGTAHLRIQVQANGKNLSAERHTVDADFFRTLGIGILSGREFNARDEVSAPKVAVVNATLAARLWPGKNPVGQSLSSQKVSMQVVGVVRDSKYGSVWEEPQPYLYVADAQAGAPASFLIMRTRLDPRDAAAMVTTQWKEILPRSPLYGFQTGNDLLNTALAPQRIAAWVFGAFGLLAIALAAVGLYSVMAYAVARRTREIGIRVAIGAKPAMVVRQVLGHSMAVAAVGTAAGIAISLLLVRYIETQVKGVSVYDASVFAAVAALVGTISVLAAALPARRAVSIEPQLALRSE